MTGAGGQVTGATWGQVTGAGGQVTGAGGQVTGAGGHHARLLLWCIPALELWLGQ